MQDKIYIDGQKLKTLIDNFVMNKAKRKKQTEYRERHGLTHDDMFRIYKKGYIGRLKYHYISGLLDISDCVVGM